MKIEFSSSGPGMAGILKGLEVLEGADVLVGIPEGDNRKQDLLDRATALKMTPSGKLSKEAQKLIDAANAPISNAELLFIFTNGSPLRGQRPRVVIEAAIEAEPTKGLIAEEMAKAAISAIDGDESKMYEHLDLAGQIAESASKRWFTDPQNGWEPNALSTVKAKGSDTPGIDTGQMRRAIIHVLETGHGVSRIDTQSPSEAQGEIGEALQVTEEAEVMV